MIPESCLDGSSGAWLDVWGLPGCRTLASLAPRLPAVFSQLWGRRAGRTEGRGGMWSFSATLMFSPLWSETQPRPLFTPVCPLRVTIHVLLVPQTPRGCGSGCAQGQGLSAGGAHGEGLMHGKERGGDRGLVARAPRLSWSHRAFLLGGDGTPHALQTPICLSSCLSFPLAEWVGHPDQVEQWGLVFPRLNIDRVPGAGGQNSQESGGGIGLPPVSLLGSLRRQGWAGAGQAWGLVEPRWGWRGWPGGRGRGLFALG